MCSDRDAVIVLRVRLIRFSRAALNCSAARLRLALIEPPAYRGMSRRTWKDSSSPSEFGGRLKALGGVTVPVVSLSE